MIDTRTLHDEIERAVARFTDETTRAWADARKRYFLDLTADPRPWWAHVRAANTNGSILLDSYACLLTPEAVEELGLDLTLTLITVGVTTERSELFQPPTPDQ